METTVVPINQSMIQEFKEIILLAVFNYFLRRFSRYILRSSSGEFYRVLLVLIIRPDIIFKSLKRKRKDEESKNIYIGCVQKIPSINWFSTASSVFNERAL